MPIYQIILIIAVVILVLSLLLNVLFSPVTWAIVGVLVIYSFIRRYFYEKQINEYNEKIEKEMAEKKAAYQSGEAYRRGSEDIIDVDYVEKEEK